MISTMTFERDWKEQWIDQMGLIVALSGEQRFTKLTEFKQKMELLVPDARNQLRKAIRQRFTPTNGQDGCMSAMQAVKEL